MKRMIFWWFRACLHTIGLQKAIECEHCTSNLKPQLDVLICSQNWKTHFLFNNLSHAGVAFHYFGNNSKCIILSSIQNPCIRPSSLRQAMLHRKHTSRFSTHKTPNTHTADGPSIYWSLTILCTSEAFCINLQAERTTNMSAWWIGRT